jgi:hypothetical protein
VTQNSWWSTTVTFTYLSIGYIFYRYNLSECTPLMHVSLHFRKFHQTVVILWNYHPAADKWFRRIIPPQIALQKETEKYTCRLFGWFTCSLQNWRIRTTLSSQSNRRLRFYRPHIHCDTFGSGTQQINWVPPTRPQRYASLLFPRTHQRQDWIYRCLQSVHWPCEYDSKLRYFLTDIADKSPG